MGAYGTEKRVEMQWKSSLSLSFLLACPSLFSLFPATFGSNRGIGPNGSGQRVNGSVWFVPVWLGIQNEMIVFLSSDFFYWSQG